MNVLSHVFSKNRFLLVRSLRNSNNQRTALLHYKLVPINGNSFFKTFDALFQSTSYTQKQWIRCLSSEPIKELTLPTFQYAGIPKLISDSKPVELTQNSLIWLHESTGLPWWTTIMLAAFAMRTFITLPLTIHQITVAARLKNLNPVLQEIQKQAAIDVQCAQRTSKLSQYQAKSMYNRQVYKEWTRLIVRDNCHPSKQFIPVLIQIPIWLSLTFAIRNLCHMLPHVNEASIITMFELKFGGFGWTQDLTAPDSLLIFPIIYGLSNLTIIQIQSILQMQDSRFRKIIINVLRGFSILMIAIAAYIPSSLTIYWVTSAICGVFQNLILASPKVRRIVGIPKYSGEISNPYRQLYNSIRKPFGIRPKPPQKKKPFMKL